MKDWTANDWTINTPDYCVVATEVWGSASTQTSVANIKFDKNVPPVTPATPLSFGPLTIDVSKTDYGIYGKNYCKFNDAAHLFNSDGGGYGSIGGGLKDSMISGTMNIGVKAVVGNVKSNMATTTFRSSIVYGYVLARGQVDGEAGGVVKSNINADVGALEFSFDSSKFVSGSGSLPYNNAEKQTFEIPPGSYGDFNANNYNNITLSSGVYYFNSFKVGCANNIYFPATGAVVIFVKDNLQMHTGTKMLTTGTNSGADPSRILVVAGGPDYSQLESEVHWRGTLIAPNSAITVNVDDYTNEFAALPYTDVTARHGAAYGAFYGKAVEVHQYNPVFACPFDYSSLASMSPVLSSNADLAGLTVSPGTLTPSFNPATEGYGVTVDNSVTSVTITAQPADANATVTINGLPGNSQTVSTIDGTMRVTIRVVAQDGRTTRTYAVDVTRSSSGGGRTTPQPTVPITKSDTTVTVNGTVTYTLTLAGGGNITTFRFDSVDGKTLADVKFKVNDTDYASKTYSINNTTLTSPAAAVKVVITTTQPRQIKIAYW
jgi:hypothetical protein